jgi:WD40 repeat protein
VKSVCFSPGGKYIISGSNNTVRIWDWENQKEIRKLEGHTDKVTCVCASPDGKYIASASCDKTVKIWNIENGTEVRRLIHLNVESV